MWRTRRGKIGGWSRRRTLSRGSSGYSGSSLGAAKVADVRYEPYPYPCQLVVIRTGQRGDVDEDRRTAPRPSNEKEHFFNRAFSTKEIR